ncbi:hypothetical protein [Pontibacter flavimaris]|uniref:RiboL-PSP-HEPN domain-containing protein n=1 Tax=Pontibacter flavimaris TaxID=1797110 RepID=A0A1Q5PFA1_9BACT|nr:hypothetical protein [Pontibacter flavimaris]OKL40841.1 hypothetical protein A3841_13420 [Pontibacter flavimaris]
MGTKQRYNLSSQFIVGLESIANSITTPSQVTDFLSIHQKNLTAILYAVTYIEAKINEFIAVFEIDTRTKLHSSIKAVTDVQRKISVIEKFNLLCILLNENSWDSSKEPFQSFEMIIFIRNEVVHYKGKFEDGGKYPKKIKNLFHELDCTVEENKLWLNVLLECDRLPSWILKVVNRIDDTINKKILKHL